MSDELQIALAQKARAEAEAADAGGGGEGVPEWMVTFADMMTLLLCFFVLLLSFANQDIQKFRDMMGSMKDAFGVQTERPTAMHTAWSPSKYERKGVKMSQDTKDQLRLVDSIKSLIHPEKELRGKANVATDQDGVLLRVDSRVMFKPGSATLRPEAYPVLDNVIEILKNFNYNLVVRGHTDDENFTSQVYPSNWELSAARAAAALRYILEKGGVSPTRLKAVGYAGTRPLVPNTSEDNRSLNRRVEFFYHNPGNEASW